MKTTIALAIAALAFASIGNAAPFISTKHAVTILKQHRNICYERNISCGADSNCCSGSCSNHYCD